MKISNQCDPAVLERLALLLNTGTDGLFRDPEDQRDLRVALRIGCEFYSFLASSPQRPPDDDCEYVAQTVRSGLDQLYSLAFGSNMVGTLPVPEVTQAALDYKSLREEVVRVFEGLLDESITPEVRVRRLLRLAKLELMFLALSFPG